MKTADRNDDLKEDDPCPCCDGMLMLCATCDENGDQIGRQFDCSFCDFVLLLPDEPPAPEIIRITEVRAVRQPDGRWRGIVRLGDTGTIEIVRESWAQAWAFCEHHLEREESENV